MDLLNKIDETSGVESNYQNVYKKIEDILDHMASYCKMTKKELIWTKDVDNMWASSIDGSTR